MAPVRLVAAVRRPTSRPALRATGILAITAAIGAGIAPRGAPPVLLNRTPSEPPGIYIRAGDPVRPGAVIAFRTPAAAFPYADRHMVYLHTRSILKAVAAGPGDQVCAAGAELVINGVDRAPIQRRDGEGRALPRWTGCRTLGPDELFVFSDRVPNSFDSRYYGPVQRQAVLGVYRLAAAL